MNLVAMMYDQVVEGFEADLARDYPGITWTSARYAEMARLGHIEQGSQRRPTGMLITATDEAGRTSQRLAPTDLVQASVKTDGLPGILQVIADQLIRQIGRDYPEASVESSEA